MVSVKPDIVIERENEIISNIFLFHSDNGFLV